MHSDISSLRRWVIAAVTLITIAANSQSYVNFEGKQCRPVCLSPDGTRLFAVNTPDAKVSVFDVTQPLSPSLIAEISTGIEPVSVNARNNDEIWVVNEVSDSVSIISVSNRMVMDTLSVKDEPSDVVFANGRAFVSASRNNQIAVFNVTNHVLLTNIAVFGGNPRSLAVNTNGTRVYAAFALSGNRTTVIPEFLNPITNQGPPFTPPLKAGLPPAPRVAAIVDVSNAAITYRMPDNDVVEINPTNSAILRYFTNVGTVNFAIAVQPGSGNLFVANTDARNRVRFEPNVRGNFVTNRVTMISTNNSARTHFNLNPGYSLTNFTLADRTNALAQPTAIVFEPDGTNYYVAAFGSDRIARVTASSGVVNARIELNPTAVGSGVDSRNMRGPRGLALKPGQALYVLNRIANTISIVNVTNNSVVAEIPTGSFDPTPAVIRQGRGFLFDAKLSGNGTVSCASCHVDAEMDKIAWDLGNPQGDLGTNLTFFTPTSPGTNQTVHPMKGPMTTQTLRGLKGLEPLHWRGDRTNFQHFNGAFDSLMGRSLLPAADMKAYADYIDTVVFEPNPNQNLDRTYPTSFKNGNAQTGLTTFLNTNYDNALNLKCASCHLGPPAPGTSKIIIARQHSRDSQDLKVPHLRNIYQKLNFNNTAGQSTIDGYGILHSGEEGYLTNFLTDDIFTNFLTNAQLKRNIAAFLECFDTGTAPAVGYTRTLTVSNVAVVAVSNDWSTLQSQAIGATNIDLIVKGTIDGVRHGLLYQPGPQTYKPDSTNLPSYTRAQLVAKVLAGDRLTVMGVPPGSGQRMGIDRDLNGVLDADQVVTEIVLPVATLEDTLTNVVLSPGALGGTLTYAILAGPTNGALGVLGTSTGLVSYTPTNNYNGPDTFSYTVTDGLLLSTGRVSVTVIAVNDAPAANNQNVATLEDTLTNIVVSATDVDSIGLVYAILTGPTNGTLGALNTGSGLVSYTPTNNYNGPDSFRFTASDGSLLSTGAVSITVIAVNDRPAANSQSVATLEDTPTNIVVSASDIDSVGLVYAILTTPTNGTLGALNSSSGLVSYTPTNNYNGTDTFRFTASDGSLLSTGVVSITVIAVNDAPVANNQLVSTLEDTLTNIVVTASDIDSTNLTFAILVNPTNGTLGALNTSSGAVSYTPTNNYNGPDTFSFTVSDGSLLSTGAVSITVIAVNDSPVANSQIVATLEDTLTNIIVSATDIDSTNLTFAILAGPTNGTLSVLNATNGAVNYTPTNNYNGSDAFSFTASDGSLLSTGVVSITVIAVNDPPVFVQTPPDVGVSELSTLTVTNNATDVDVPAQTLTYQLLSPPTGAGIDGSGVITWTPNIHQGTSTNTITTVVDDGIASVTNAFRVTVLNWVVPPELLSVSMSNDVVTLTWSAINGENYVLEYVNDLSDTNWTPVLPSVQATGVTATMTNAVIGTPSRFFRIMVPTE